MNATMTPTSTPLPWADTFFSGAIRSHHLAHAYVLKGKASSAMYQMALQIAQVLNCQNPIASSTDNPSLNQLSCGQCTNCKWIKSNSHPAVLTVSRLTYQVNDKGELMTPEELEKQSKKSTPTQIKTDQIGRLIQQLGVSSEYVRVVIFTDAEELPASIPADTIPPFDWRAIEANEDKSFHIRPLERSIFNAFSVNKFLKTLEEPPPKTLFFFITETEEQLLETIVSRCQVVPCMTDSLTVNSQLSENYAQFTQALLLKLQQKQDAYALTNEFERFFVTDAGLTLAQALNILQQGLRDQFLSQAATEQSFTAYRKQQQHIDTALRMMDAKANESQSLLHLFLQLAAQ